MSNPEQLITRAEATAVPQAQLVLAFEQRVRTRHLANLEDGRPVSILVPRGSVLRGGDRWQTASGLVIEIVAAREALIEVRSTDAQCLARAAYHLGNRHVAVEVGVGVLRVLRDPVLATLLSGLGLVPEETVGPFEPEGGAYGHDHGHQGHAHTLAPVIHEFRPG